MVHYIRFLKAPQLYSVSKSRQVVKALVTITTDLGDEFLASDLRLHVKLIRSDGNDDPSCESQRAHWKAGMRVLWVEAGTTHFDEMRISKLLVTTARDGVARLHHNLSEDALHDVVDCRSNISGLATTNIPSSRVERLFMLKPNIILSIFEYTGESIARHIWCVRLRSGTLC